MSMHYFLSTKLVFLHPVHLRHEISMHNCSSPCGTDKDSTKKHAGTRNADLVFLHQVGSVGNIVYSSLFGP
jgi:hypothetical protein